MFSKVVLRAPFGPTSPVARPAGKHSAYPIITPGGFR